MPRSTRYPAACTPCDLCSLRPVYRALVCKHLQLRDRRPPACAPGRGLVTRRGPRPARRGSSHLRSRANSLEVYADGPAAHRRDQTQGASVVVPCIRGRAATQGVRRCGAGRLRQPGSRARTSLAYPLQPSSTGARWEGRETADLDRCHQVYGHQITEVRSRCSLFLFAAWQRAWAGRATPATGARASFVRAFSWTYRTCRTHWAACLTRQ